MTKITLFSDGYEYSASTESDGLAAEELVDMFGGLMIAATYAHATVCDVLNTQTFNNEDE